MADSMFNFYDSLKERRDAPRQVAMDYSKIPEGRVAAAVMAQTAGMLGGQAMEAAGYQTADQIRNEKIMEIRQQFPNPTTDADFRQIGNAFNNIGETGYAEKAFDQIKAGSTSAQKFNFDTQASALQQAFIAEHPEGLDTIGNLKKFKKQLEQAGLGNTTIYGRVSADLRTLRGEEAKSGKFTSTQVTDLSKQMTDNNLPEMQNRISNMERLILKFKGKNMPGINFFEQAEAWWDDDAKEVQSAFSELRNVVLKDRSGAAVTNPEFERLKEEIRGSTTVTDKDVIRWTKRLRQVLDTDVNAVLAGYDDDAVSVYLKRAGSVETTRRTSGLSAEDQALIDKYSK